MSEAPPRGSRAIRGFALACVAITSAFMIYMVVWSTELLSSDGWCDRAIGASKAAEGTVRPEYAVGGCFTLLKDQVGAIAWNSHMLVGVLALCLLVLMVVVVAEAHLRGKGSRDGVEFDIGSRGERMPETPAQGAQAATDAAQQVTDQLADGKE